MFEKRFLFSFGIIFVFFSLFDLLFHGLVIRDLYIQSPSLWRPMEDIRQYFAFLVFGELLVSYFFCYIFEKGFRGKGVLHGFKYALIIYGLYVSQVFMRFSIEPIPFPLFSFWLLGVFIEITLGGIILSLLSEQLESRIS